MEAQQCLGGNGYINGALAAPTTYVSAFRLLTIGAILTSHRIPHGPFPARRTSVHSRCGHAGDPTDAHWARVQPGLQTLIMNWTHACRILLIAPCRELGAARLVTPQRMPTSYRTEPHTGQTYWNVD